MSEVQPKSPVARDADAGVAPMFAAGGLVITGVMHALLGATFLVNFVMESTEWAFVYVITGGGVTAVALAWFVGAARPWAVVSAAVLVPVLGLTSLGFTVWGLWNGALALYSLFAPPSAAFALMTVLVALGPTLRAARAQRAIDHRYGSGSMFGG
ncbi:MAG: hypothetical protein ABMA64_07020 [Myxococcota bacterium]